MNHTRFRFRIWDNEIKEYLIGCFLVGGEMIHNAVDHESFLDTGNFVIEQCTGVKDTNDNLIYENDIVEQSPSRNKYKIIWIDTDCGWGLENAQTGFIRTMNCFDGDELEIIGNIHEQKD